MFPKGGTLIHKFPTGAEKRIAEYTVKPGMLSASLLFGEGVILEGRGECFQNSLLSVLQESVEV